MQKYKVIIMLTFIISFLVLSNGIAQIEPARIFSDNMVLQREIEIPVWGIASPGEIIKVSLGTSVSETTTNSHGHWRVILPKLVAGGPFQMIIKSISDTVILRNVLIGDVWLASGQSNMEHPMQGWQWIPHSNIKNATVEIADSDYPNIRLFSVTKYPSPVEQSDLFGGKWECAGPEAVGGFSSISWFFAKKLHQKLNVPIGIINCSWGGTPIKAWMSRDMLENFKDQLKVPTIPENFDLSQWSLKVTKSLEKHIVRRNQISYPLNDLPEKISEAGFDDSSWDKVSLLDKSTNCGNVVWLRKTINIPERDADKPMTLSLGFLKRQSNIYWNGNELGYCQYPKPTRFGVPKNLIHSGENILAVRIAQPFGETRVLGEGDQFFISTVDDSFKTSLVENWKSNTHLESINPASKSYQGNPAYLFNGMIAPIVPYGIKGFIWYQGESDAVHPDLYEKMFQKLIIGWRKRWGLGDLPFLFVQLSNIELSHHFEKKNASWCQLREAQKKALILPKTGMVVSMDIGDPYDIHSKNKKEFAERLALQAEEKVYGKKVISDGPLAESYRVKDNTIIVKFKTEGKLTINSDVGFNSFEVEGTDNQYYPADIKLSDNQIIISSPEVKNPLTARYAWSNNPKCTLYNSARLPAAPFNTKYLKIKK